MALDDCPKIWKFEDVQIPQKTRLQADSRKQTYIMSSFNSHAVFDNEIMDFCTSAPYLISEVTNVWLYPLFFASYSGSENYWSKRAPWDPMKPVKGSEKKKVKDW